MEITQRTATMEDADILLTWRNHPNTRKFSRNPEKILVRQHIRWLADRLGKTQLQPFYLFIEDGRAIAMSRLDAVPESIQKYQISILVDPDRHGEGLGTKILSLTCESFFHMYPENTIVAYINRNNHVSQKLFIKAGFKLKSSLDEFQYFEKSLN